MIRVAIQKNSKDVINSIEVSGHANYAPHGYDIICASVSTLLQVVGATLLDKPDTISNVDFETAGFGVIDINNPNRDSHLITSVFEKGASLLAEQYSDFVTLEMR